MDKKDYVVQVMDEWYLAMASNNVSVQPKASTLLGMVLANYDIKLKQDTKNIWDEFLTITGGQFADWYSSLNEKQRETFQTEASSLRRTNADPIDTKSLLKG